MPSATRPSLPETIASDIRTEILTGVLAPGDRLPSEAALAEKHGTNRTTLREAIRILGAEGLIRVGQGRPAEVADYRETGTLALLPAFIETREKPQDVTRLVGGILGVRRQALLMMLPEAIENGTAADFVALHGAAHAICKADPDDTTAIIALDEQFYRCIIAATHNLFYLFLFNSFMEAYAPLSNLASSFVHFPSSYFARIGELAQAMEQGAKDGSTDRATALLRIHLESIDDEMETMLEALKELSG